MSTKATRDARAQAVTAELKKVAAGEIRDTNEIRRLLRESKLCLSSFNNPIETALHSARYSAEAAFVSGWDGSDDDDE